MPCKSPGTSSPANKYRPLDHSITRIIEKMKLLRKKYAKSFGGSKIVLTFAV